MIEHWFNKLRAWLESTPPGEAGSAGIPARHDALWLRFLKELEREKIAPDYRELADLLWLERWMARPAQPDDPGRQRVEREDRPRFLVARAKVSAAHFPNSMAQKQQELPIIQKVYDLILWYVPVVNRLPRDFKFTLGERITTGLYKLLDDLIEARYATKKLHLLEAINTALDRLRFQTRLLHDFKLLDTQGYGQASKRINAVGVDLGNWIKQQKSLAA